MGFYRSQEGRRTTDTYSTHSAMLLIRYTLYVIRYRRLSPLEKTVPG